MNKEIEEALLLRGTREEFGIDAQNYLYNVFRDRRYEFRLGEGGVRSIALLGQTYGGTWGDLMTVGVYRSKDKDQNLQYLLSVGVLTGRGGCNHCSTEHLFYTTEEPHWRMGYGTGFYGDLLRIERELRAMGMQAVYAKELPKKVDVDATMHLFLNNLKNRIFTPPTFVEIR